VATDVRSGCDYKYVTIYIASNDWVVVNTELERIWKEAVIGILPAGTWESYEVPQSG
jgi:hypothetical protein